MEKITVFDGKTCLLLLAMLLLLGGGSLFALRPLFFMFLVLLLPLRDRAEHCRGGALPRSLESKQPYDVVESEIMVDPSPTQGVLSACRKCPSIPDKNGVKFAEKASPPRACCGVYTTALFWYVYPVPHLGVASCALLSPWGEPCGAYSNHVELQSRCL